MLSEDFAVNRPISLHEFVARLEPDCLDPDVDEMAWQWTLRSCPRLVTHAQSIGLDVWKLRRAAFDMLRYSSRHLVVARDGCEAAFAELDLGILSILVAGSTARGEAVEGSDVDFNVYMTDAFLDTLRQRRDAKASTPATLLRNYEAKLRLRHQDPLLSALQERGVAEDRERLTLKPFSRSSLEDLDDTLTAYPHLNNIVYGDTPVRGDEQFYELLDAVTSNTVAQEAALVARIAYLRAGEMQFDAENSVKSAHSVAACISAVIASGVRLDDPQIPYWWTCDAPSVEHVVPDHTQAPILGFLALVTLCRAGKLTGSDEQLAFAMENGLSGLPLAIDSIIDFLEQRGEDERTIEMWERIADFVSDPNDAKDFARRLGFVRTQ